MREIEKNSGAFDAETADASIATTISPTKSKTKKMGRLYRLSRLFELYSQMTIAFPIRILFTEGCFLYKLYQNP